MQLHSLKVIQTVDYSRDDEYPNLVTAEAPVQSLKALQYTYHGIYMINCLYSSNNLFVVAR